jgi:hypothetical protein
MASGPARAQRGTDQNLFLDILPGLRAAPAPSWVRPGTRITYYSTAASIAAERTKLIEDPNGPWEIIGTGKRYREEDISGAGVGRAGYSVVNVVYMDRSVAVLDIGLYSINPSVGPAAHLFGFMSAVGVPGAGSDFWMNPRVLVAAQGRQVGDAVRILRMMYDLNGRRHAVTRLQASTGSWNYEEASGLLLRTTASAETTVLVPPQGTQGPVVQRAGATLLTQNTLVSVRTPSVPWANVPAPSWLATTRRLQYNGSHTTYVAGQSVRIPMSAVFERQHLGGQWARYLMHVITQNVPGLPPHQVTWNRVFGSAQLGGLWVPPQAMVQLRPGQVMDTDPGTRMTIVVSDDPGGAFAVTEANHVQRIDYGYDRQSGIMTSLRLTDQVLHTVIDLRLIGVR